MVLMVLFRERAIGVVDNLADFSCRWHGCALVDAKAQHEPGAGWKWHAADQRVTTTGMSCGGYLHLRVLTPLSGQSTFCALGHI